MVNCHAYCIGISDLGEVLKILRKHLFNSSDYFDFCLYLGLLNPTIKGIQEKYRGDPQSCLREGLTLWLMKADHVPKKGDPTWYTLLEALRSLDVAVADKIDKESN